MPVNLQFTGLLYDEARIPMEEHAKSAVLLPTIHKEQTTIGPPNNSLTNLFVALPTNDTKSTTGYMKERHLLIGVGLFRPCRTVYRSAALTVVTLGISLLLGHGIGRRGILGFRLVDDSSS